MGQRASCMPQADLGPATAKHSEDGESSGHRISWGLSAMQGHRDSMEDAHIATGSVTDFAAAALGSASPSSRGYGGSSPSKPPKRGAAPSKWDNTAMFAVMDGHGGVQVARFCERYLPSELAKEPDEDVGAALVAALPRVDEMLVDPSYISEFRTMTWPSSGTSVSKNLYDSFLGHPKYIGSCANVCCLRDGYITVGNVGDSRAVLCRAGQAIDLSEDHKPILPRERDRILKAGGYVDMEEERVCGDLAVSRALGDHEFKEDPGLSPGEQIISCVPELSHTRQTTQDEFVVLACDGVWDVMSSQDVVDFFAKRLGERRTLASRLESGELRLSQLTEELLDYCISPDLGSSDNMTAILVVLLPRTPSKVAEDPRRAAVPSYVSSQPPVLNVQLQPLLVNSQHAHHVTSAPPSPMPSLQAPGPVPGRHVFLPEPHRR
eukprot:TRINITY_DN37840_c0_g1_i2.p1 TRINITY_DN37840_c0_g1~~TRINITY_DN37840_c0_g1_i2.p1  ORF type:complete len:435 (+),score=90.26 TRINITY_DN37840_c0_g1_i2:245-1549(+)